MNTTFCRKDMCKKVCKQMAAATTPEIVDEAVTIFCREIGVYEIYEILDILTEMAQHNKKPLTEEEVE